MSLHPLQDHLPSLVWGERLIVLGRIAVRPIRTFRYLGSVLKVAGVSGLVEDGTVRYVRLCDYPSRFKLRPLEQWTVRREYLGRLKPAFDEQGIEIPFAPLTVCAGVDRTGRAPAFRMSGFMP